MYTDNAYLSNNGWDWLNLVQVEWHVLRRERIDLEGTDESWMKSNIGRVRLWPGRNRSQMLFVDPSIGKSITMTAHDQSRYWICLELNQRERWKSSRAINKPTIDVRKKNHDKYSTGNKQPSRHQYIQIRFCSHTPLMSLPLVVSVRSSAIIQRRIMMMTMLMMCRSKVLGEWANDYLFFSSRLSILIISAVAFPGKEIVRRDWQQVNEWIK